MTVRYFAAALLSTPLLTVALSVPAHAQAVNGYKFLQAVKDRDGDTVTSMLDLPGGTLINTRDLSNGQSAIHIVSERRDLVWMKFLLDRGANPNATDKAGNTPLVLATQARHQDGVTLLLDKGANVNQGGARGETPLMKAVMNRDLAMVRLLVARGADPDKSDSFSGSSPRSLAKRDPRASSILAALEAPKAASDKPVMGPSIK